MPERPTWTQIGEFASKLTNKDKEQCTVSACAARPAGADLALITVANAYWRALV